MEKLRLTASLDRDSHDRESSSADHELVDLELTAPPAIHDHRSRLLLEAFGASHSGRRRLNQDQFLIADLAAARRHEDEPATSRPATESLLVVADGLGGHPSGEVASLLAVKVLLSELLQTPYEAGNPLIRLDRAIRASDEALHRAGMRRDDLASMGTTITAAWWIAPMLYFAHVGHSRLYLLRGGRMSRLTRDHTLSAGMSEAGFDQAKAAGFEHVLTQALGGDLEGVDPEGGCRRLHSGDSLLLCTDGLVRGLDDDAIQRVLERSASTQDAATDLIESALATDDHDNITALVARVSMPRGFGARASA